MIAFWGNSRTFKFVILIKKIYAAIEKSLKIPTDCDRFLEDTDVRWRDSPRDSQRRIARARVTSRQVYIVQ